MLVLGSELFISSSTASVRLLAFYQLQRVLLPFKASASVAGSAWDSAQMSQCLGMMMGDN